MNKVTLKTFLPQNVAGFSCVTVFSIYLFCAVPDFLSTPPYWDSVVAVFREGLWLHDNQWNYTKLMFSEPGYAAGGARTYLYSLYPLLISLLYGIFPQPEQVFVALHGLQLFFAGAIILSLTDLLRRSGSPWLEALLGGLVFALWPLLLSQTIAMNMELASAFCVICALKSLVRRKPERSIIWIFFGLFIKANVAVAGVAFAATILICRKEFSLTRVQALTRAALFCLPLALYMLIGRLEKDFFYRGGADGQLDLTVLGRPLELLARLSGLSSNALLFVPDIYFLTLLISFIALFVIIRCMLPNFDSLERGMRAVGDPGAKDYLSHIRILFRAAVFTVAVFHLAHTVFSLPLPRYTTVYLAPMCLVLVLISSLFRRTVGWSLLAALLCWNILNREGRLYEAFFLQWKGNDGFIIERTLLAREAIQRDLSLSQFLEQSHAGETILTSWPYYWQLTDPRYGYVHRAMSALSLFRGEKPSCEILNNTPPEKSLLLNANNVFEVPEVANLRCPIAKVFAVREQYAVSLESLRDCNYRSSCSH